MHDVVCAQQHVTFAARIAGRQRAFIKSDQVAQRRARHHTAFLVHERGGNKNAVANEVSHKPRGWPVVQRISVFPLVQMAFVHHADTVADGKGFELVVGHKQGCGARCLQDGAHLMRQPFTQIDIQIGKRLVEQQQARPRCQRPRQRHALLLPARQFMRKAFVRRAHADQFQHLVDTLLAGVGFQMRQAESHILGHVQMRKQGVVLKNHANLARFGGNMGLRTADEVFSQPDGARVGALQAGDGTQQSGLAATRRANQYANFARLQVEGHAIDGRMGASCVMHPELRDFQKHRFIVDAYNSHLQ